MDSSPSSENKTKGLSFEDYQSIPTYKLKQIGNGVYIVDTANRIEGTANLYKVNSEEAVSRLQGLYKNVSEARGNVLNKPGRLGSDDTDVVNYRNALSQYESAFKELEDAGKIDKNFIKVEIDPDRYGEYQTAEAIRIKGGAKSEQEYASLAPEEKREYGPAVIRDIDLDKPPEDARRTYTSPGWAYGDAKIDRDEEARKFAESEGITEKPKTEESTYEEKSPSDDELEKRMNELADRQSSKGGAYPGYRPKDRAERLLKEAGSYGEGERLKDIQKDLESSGGREKEGYEPKEPYDTGSPDEAIKRTLESSGLGPSSDYKWSPPPKKVNWSKVPSIPIEGPKEKYRTDWSKARTVPIEGREDRKIPTEVGATGYQGSSEISTQLPVEPLSQTQAQQQYRPKTVGFSQMSEDLRKQLEDAAEEYAVIRAKIKGSEAQVVIEHNEMIKDSEGWVVIKPPGGRKVQYRQKADPTMKKDEEWLRGILNKTDYGRMLMGDIHRGTYKLSDEAEKDVAEYKKIAWDYWIKRLDEKTKIEDLHDEVGRLEKAKFGGLRGYDRQYQPPQPTTHARVDTGSELAQVLDAGNALYKILKKKEENGTLTEEDEANFLKAKLLALQAYENEKNRRPSAVPASQNASATAATA